MQVCIKAIQDFDHSSFGSRGGKHGNIFWDNKSYAIKHAPKLFAELASVTLKQMADTMGEYRSTSKGASSIGLRVGIEKKLKMD